MAKDNGEMRLARRQLQVFHDALTAQLVMIRAQEIGCGEGKGRVMLAVLSKQEDGGGRVVCDFEAEDFMHDLKMLLQDDRWPRKGLRIEDTP
jgi:hypothetical protein